MSFPQTESWHTHLPWWLPPQLLQWAVEVGTQCPITLVDVVEEGEEAEVLLRVEEEAEVEVSLPKWKQ